jgi:3-oxoacyl-[acyl-carrier protein] reductase
LPEKVADGARSLAIQADNADVLAVKAAIAETVKTFGRLDVLVNNAWILRFGAISNYSLEELDRMIAVNIKGLFVAIQEAIRHMQEGGRIINVGSISSDFVPFNGASVYAMTKGAVASLRRGLARELGPCGITVNNVQPGANRHWHESIRWPLGGPVFEAARGATVWPMR